MSMRPADACPYPKPFSADFNDCPTYQTRHAIVVDSTDRPLRTIWSCRHMETRQVPGEPGHYYGACELGDARARQETVQRIGADRIRKVQELRRQVMPLAQAFVDDIAILRCLRMEAIRSRQDPTPIVVRMRQRGQRYLREFEAFSAERGHLLEAAGMPLAGMMQLARRWVDEFISETLGQSRPAAELPDDLVGSLPESVRVFYAPS